MSQEYLLLDNIYWKKAKHLKISTVLQITYVVNNDKVHIIFAKYSPFYLNFDTLRQHSLIDYFLIDFTTHPQNLIWQTTSRKNWLWYFFLFDTYPWMKPKIIALIICQIYIIYKFNSTLDCNQGISLRKYSFKLLIIVFLIQLETFCPSH